MANYYRILSAYSDDGEGLSVPVPWNLDSVDDLSVVIVGDSGKPQEIDYWNWDSKLKQIEIPNSQNFKVWSAYVSRKEDAVALFQLIESHEINAQNILEQFQKISRILESLQENEKTFLSSPDYMGGFLPNASHRASKFVSFDEDGKPVCDIPTETFDDAVGFMEKAVGEAEEAFGEIVTAKTAEFNSNAASKKEEINTLAAQAETSKNAAITAANGATAAAQAAATSQTAAAASKTLAEESATEAQGFAQAAATAQAAAENAAQIAQATDAGKLALSKLSAGTLYFNQAKLFGSNFTIPNFPFSICATVRVDSWEGSTEGGQTIFQFGENNGAGAIVGSMSFNHIQNAPDIQLRIGKNIDGIVYASERYYVLNKNAFLGKEHTIVGIYRELESTPLNFDMYVDGEKVATTPSKGLTLDSLSGTFNYAVNTSNSNYSSQPASKHSMMLRNLYVFNFDVSAEDAPYSVADYEAGRLIPPSLIGNQFTGMYGSGWSVSGDTATCSGTSTISYPRITGGVIPSGFNFSFTIDIELSFSGTPSFEVYTSCQKAYAEIYDYSTGLTSQKNSAPGGGFYGNASLGITASGHYRIKFDCESSLGVRGEMQMVIGALSSGTIILSNTYYTRCNLALENYTIARNATTTLVKDASGNSNDATVQGSGTVAGDNDQSIKAFVDEIKTQINQSNG